MKERKKCHVLLDTHFRYSRFIPISAIANKIKKSLNSFSSSPAPHGWIIRAVHSGLSWQVEAGVLQIRLVTYHKLFAPCIIHLLLSRASYILFRSGPWLVPIVSETTALPFLIRRNASSIPSIGVHVLSRLGKGSGGGEGMDTRHWFRNKIESEQPCFERRLFNPFSDKGIIFLRGIGFHVRMEPDVSLTRCVRFAASDD